MVKDSICRGDIWLINLDPAVGAEIKKTRPAVVVNVNEIEVLPLKIIVPVTTWKERYQFAPWMIPLEPGEENGLKNKSAVDAFQVRSLSQSRFIQRLGRVSAKEMERIMYALVLVLGIHFTE